MVTVSPRPANPDAEPDPVDENTVAGLARELDQLQRTVAPLTGLDGRLDDLAGVVADLATKVTALSARKGPTPCPSWL